MKQWKNIVLTNRDSCTDVFLWIIWNIQNNFFKEHVWTAVSDLGKYLKTLAIIIAFVAYIWGFGICENRV